MARYIRTSRVVSTASALFIRGIPLTGFEPRRNKKMSAVPVYICNRCVRRRTHSWTRICRGRRAVSGFCNARSGMNNSCRADGPGWQIQRGNWQFLDSQDLPEFPRNTARRLFQLEISRQEGDRLSVRSSAFSSSPSAAVVRATPSGAKSMFENYLVGRPHTHAFISAYRVG